MKTFLLLLPLLSSSFAGFGQQVEGKWVNTNQQNCKYYDGQSYAGKIDEVTWSGSCKNGYAEGEGKLVITGISKGRYGGKYSCYTYTGSISEGKLNGNGEVYFNDMYYRKGYFQNGILNGKGNIRWGSTFYEGDFVNDRYEGNGILTDNYYNYEGGFKEGKYHGTGKLIKKDECVYTGGFENGLYSGPGVLCFENGDTLYAIFVKGKAFDHMCYIYKNGIKFIGTTYNDKPYSGSFYKDDVFQYEYQSGSLLVKEEERKKEVIKSEPVATSYPEGQYNPWNTYTKSKPEGSTAYEPEVKSEPSNSGYSKGVATYKGLGDYDLAIEIEAEVLYQSRKDPGLLGLRYYDIAEAKGIRFRYPGNSSAWHSFGSGDSIYTCYYESVKYTCANIGGMVFQLVSPDIY